jgi:putative transposase
MILTYRYRIKDRHAKRLSEMAGAVNFVWNFCGETQEHARRWSKKWPTRFDLNKLTAGAGRDLGLSSGTVEAICTQFALSRKAARRRPRWRGKRSLGWVPFRDGVVQIKDSDVVYRGQRFRFWNSRPLGGEIRTGSFSEDSEGRWYINLQCEVAEADRKQGSSIGVDLGLKTLATCSDGITIPNLRHGRTYAERLAKAQRAARKRRARAIRRKVANCRRHQHHVATTALVKRHALIAVGNINPAKLGRTRMAKSVYDASWTLFRNMLRYKAIAHGAEYVERDERYSTQTCSGCGCLGGPKGRKGLAVREWTCSECGAVHDRDVNAARNILGPECRPPRAGIAA